MPRYFLHESGYVEAGKRGTEIPRDAFASRQILFHEFQILKYTFVHTESSSLFSASLSLLVELTCGLMLTLDLDTPSKAWKLVYDGMRVALKPPRTQGNFFIIADHYHEMWCLSDIGKQSKLASAEKSPLSSCFPLSSFGEEDPVKSLVGSSLTPLPSLENDDDDKQKQKKKQYFCIVQGAVSRNSKLPRVVMDVVDAQAAPPQSVASCRFGVPTHKCKRFLPYCIFPYHPYP
ncbi:uncharacterized protein LOC131009538 [Salvia miltiorrhiza]|uniref:uncharacterized protein LOC131009538 n=1 Tax=Salvia miltiorrhiza TaxID=226208 RepID=UPI0025AD13E6|nr:uncharacterized protein LOC131009538 [Salvia miltiorrhiza]XP_057792921.1 uncharacterized protein LOC131009538 [Salvia miltiorrhiza]XP_057792922.1 uncharacterized protein LOC131009538 [Salvia miltiorrhiza]